MKGQRWLHSRLAPWNHSKGVDFADYSEYLSAYCIAHNIGQVAADVSEAAKREADNKKR